MQGRTALMCACKSRTVELSTVQMLLNAGANVSAQDNKVRWLTISIAPEGLCIGHQWLLKRCVNANTIATAALWQNAAAAWDTFRAVLTSITGLPRMHLPLAACHATQSANCQACSHSLFATGPLENMQAAYLLAELC